MWTFGGGRNQEFGPFGGRNFKYGHKKPSRKLLIIKINSLNDKRGDVSDVPALSLAAALHIKAQRSPLEAWHTIGQSVVGEGGGREQILIPANRDAKFNIHTNLSTHIGRTAF